MGTCYGMSARASELHRSLDTTKRWKMAVRFGTWRVKCLQVRITEDRCSTTSENRLDFAGVQGVSWHKDVAERAEDCRFVLCEGERK
jgi:hypothetical protein